MRATNVLEPKYGVRLYASSNESQIGNLQNNDDKVGLARFDQFQHLWLSNSPLPIQILLDLGEVQMEYEFLNSISINCWHDYTSNPKNIIIQVPQNGAWQNWAQLEPEMKSGFQTFEIPAIPYQVTQIKLIILETYGS